MTGPHVARGAIHGGEARPICRVLLRAIAATGWVAWRSRKARWQLAVLISPLPYTALVQVLTHFESHNMAVGAGPLVLPLACQLVDRRRLRESR